MCPRVELLSRGFTLHNRPSLPYVRDLYNKDFFWCFLRKEHQFLELARLNFLGFFGSKFALPCVKEEMLGIFLVYISYIYVSLDKNG